MTKKFLTILLLIIVAFGFISAYKIQASTSIISAKNTKLKPGEKINALIDLTNVSDIDKVELTTSIYIEPVVDLSSGIDQQDVNINKTTLTISNIKTQSIYVSYTIPTYVAGGTKIKLEATGFDDQDVEQAKSEIEVEVVVEEPHKESNVVDNKQQENADMTNTGALNTGTSNTGVLRASSTTEAAETATYKGSRNNYLSNITVDGYELNSVFNKTNNTYFITVPNDVTSVNISVDKEDSSARVTTSGNTNLKEGINKALISVIAKNGDIRYYRIYITREQAL